MFKKLILRVDLVRIKKILAAPLPENLDRQIFHQWKAQSEFLGRGGWDNAVKDLFPCVLMSRFGVSHSFFAQRNRG